MSSTAQFCGGLDIKVLDLFCGTGGFSLGAHAAGFETTIAIDIDPVLTSAFQHNFPKAKLLLADIASVTRADVERAGGHDVDGVIGGAPCQAFSEIGRNDPTDPRRGLVAHFFRLVSEVDPSFFVFENVRGLLSPRNIVELEAGLSKLGDHWQIVGPLILDASEFGAATKRRRAFVFGFNTRAGAAAPQSSLDELKEAPATVWEAIADLQGAREQGPGKWRYDLRRKVSSYAEKSRSKSGLFSGHQMTHHSTETVKRFAKTAPGSIEPIGRYPRLSLDGLCPTLRAGTGSDRGSYQAVRPIHPLEDRVITVREAARLQGFPDEFEFHSTVWHSFRMIGNSVSPIMAHKALKWAKQGLNLAR